MKAPTPKLTFVTGNPRKIAEAAKIATEFGVTFAHQSLKIDEIQHHDPLEVAKAKARAAYQILKQPVVINDASWQIPALGGFPGAYMHDMVIWFKPQDWLNLIAEYPDKSIIVIEIVVYFDGETITHFQFQQIGRFSNTPKGTGNNSIEQVAVFTGDKTIAEHHDAGGRQNNSIDLKAWRDFFNWYRSIITPIPNQIS